MTKNKDQFYVTLIVLYAIQLTVSYLLLDSMLLFSCVTVLSFIPLVMLILFTTKQDKAHASEAASQFEIKRKALISLKKREEEITEIVEKDKKLKRYSYNLLKRLKEYEQSTHTNITDVVPTPFILLDENAAIVTINKSALNFFGYPDDKSHKPSLNQLFKIGSLTSILWINKVIASNIPSLDIEVVLSDKTSKWSRVQIQKLDDKEYKYAINVVDISDLKTNSDTLTLSLDRAKIAETELKLFADIQLETNEQLLIAENQLRTLLEKEQESKAVLNQAINALKDTQGQLVHSEKMASLGQLTAGIAHEINNPINFIYNGIESLKQSLADLSEILDLYTEYDTTNEPKTLEKIKSLKDELEYDLLREDLDEMLIDIKEGAVRTIEIVKGLRIFSRLDEEAEKEANINECLDATAVLLNNKMKNRISLQKQLDGEIPEINCFPGQLNQVFMNIIGNAIQAFKDDQEDCQIQLSTNQTADNVHITIKDNGSGMSEETKNRLFEPFYTTKPVGVGTGLGLSISYGIIEKHHGKISVASEIGKGTAFTIILPKNLKTQYAKASGFSA